MNYHNQIEIVSFGKNSSKKYVELIYIKLFSNQTLLYTREALNVKGNLEII